MNKEKFITEIKEILLLEEEALENAGIEIDSMSSLLLIAFFDDNFSKSISQEDIKSFKSINDLIAFVGENNLK